MSSSFWSKNAWMTRRKLGRPSRTGCRGQMQRATAAEWRGPGGHERRRRPGTALCRSQPAEELPWIIGSACLHFKGQPVCALGGRSICPLTDQIQRVSHARRRPTPRLFARDLSCSILVRCCSFTEKFYKPIDRGRGSIDGTYDNQGNKSSRPKIYIKNEA